MTDLKATLESSARNIRKDVFITVCFISLLGALSFWFEARKNRNDFYPYDWLILAPLDLEISEQVARDSDQLASDGGEGKFKATPHMDHRLTNGHALTWTSYTSVKGVVPFITLGNKTTNAIAYAQTIISMPRKTELQLGIAADDGIKIWINGEVVFNQGPSGGYVEDKHLIIVKLKEGENQIFVKNTQLDGGWGFALHFFDK